MREIEICKKKLIIVPKALRKRFSRHTDGIFIEKNGTQVAEFHRNTESLVWLPQIFLKHFKKCVKIL